MVIHQEPATSFGLSSPAIPQRGLDEILRSWTGQGQLWAALAAAEDPVAERHWSAADIQRRAHRVVFQELEPLMASWPRSVRAWVNALPAVSERRRVIGPAPRAGVSWSETRRRGGWPPRSFVARPRYRLPDTLLATTLRWTLDQLAVIATAAAAPVDSTEVIARERLTVALGLLDEEPLAHTEPVAPTSTDIAALRSEGTPWRSVAPVAAKLRELGLEATLRELADRIVWPSAELAWRLFHLAILGELLHALRTSGASVVSLRPLGASLAGPAFLVTDADDRDWDLWFEAAGAWSYYGRADPYASAVAGVPGAGTAIGTDLMLIRPDECALLIECKYSSNPAVVARGGYEQALAYAAEAHELTAGAVTAAVVGPAGVVKSAAWADTLAGPVGVVPPDAIPVVVENALT